MRARACVYAIRVSCARAYACALFARAPFVPCACNPLYARARACACLARRAAPPVSRVFLHHSSAPARTHAQFTIIKDLTPEEEAKVREENKWVEED